MLGLKQPCHWEQLEPPLPLQPNLMESELQPDDNGGQGPDHNVPEDDDDESDKTSLHWGTFLMSACSSC